MLSFSPSGGTENGSVDPNWGTLIRYRIVPRYSKGFLQRGVNACEQRYFHGRSNTERRFPEHLRA